MIDQSATEIHMQVGDVPGLPKTPLTVTCGKCGHAWIGMYLPLPISDAARAMKNLTCPMCAASSKQICVKQ